jgi:SAM-dependent methyltransferase
VKPAVRLAGLAVLLLFALHAPAAAQDSSTPEPHINQPGKDVQWIPTPDALVEKMLDLARVTPQDRFVDLGSGDGVLVIAAARRGARARGIEYDRGLVELSKRKAKEAGVSDKTRFTRGDIFKTDFSEATVVTTFLLPSMNLQLRPTFLAMKPGTRIVANTFAIGDWQPDETVTLEEPCERWCKAMLWIVPAPVNGLWFTPKGDLALTQKFQFISGTLDDEAIENGSLHGDLITFTAGGVAYSGRVDGNRMRLTATIDGKPVEWTVRAAPRRR